MQQTKGEKFLQAFFDLLAQDYIEDAVKSLRKAVKEGNLRGMWWLGLLYYEGWLGCQYSSKRAADLWLKSAEYAPSRAMLHAGCYELGHSGNRPPLRLKDDDLIAKALYTGRPDDILKCEGMGLEFYFMYARYVCGPIETRRERLTDGANQGCTLCLRYLYWHNCATSWQLRRLWRLCPRELQVGKGCGDDLFVYNFGRKENIRHIICLLEWARKTRNSTTLAILPRDVLRMICTGLLQTFGEETKDDTHVWNYRPRKLRKTRK